MESNITKILIKKFWKRCVTLPWVAHMRYGPPFWCSLSLMTLPSAEVPALPPPRKNVPSPSWFLQVSWQLRKYIAYWKLNNWTGADLLETFKSNHKVLQAVFKMLNQSYIGRRYINNHPTFHTFSWCWYPSSLLGVPRPLIGDLNCRSSSLRSPGLCFAR